MIEAKRSMLETDCSSRDKINFENQSNPKADDRIQKSDLEINDHMR